MTTKEKIGISFSIATVVCIVVSAVSGSITAIFFTAVFFAGAAITQYAIECDIEAEERRERSYKRYALLLMQDRENAERAYRAAKIAAEIEKKYQGVN